MPLLKIVRDLITQYVFGPPGGRPLHEWIEDFDMGEDEPPEALYSHLCRGRHTTVKMRGGLVPFRGPPTNAGQPILKGYCKRCQTHLLAAVFDFSEWDDFKREMKAKHQG